MNELTTVSLGNSNISIAKFRGKKILSIFRLGYSEESVREKVSDLIKGSKAIAVCSVNKEKEENLNDLISDIREIFHVSYTNQLNFINLYKKPKQLGNDRIANLSGASELFRTSCIVIDFGTAVTVNALNSKKEFTGGFIFPGEFLMYESLGKTSLLPVITDNQPEVFPGKTTEESITAGVRNIIRHGLTDVIKRLKKELEPPVKVIVTGGGAGLFSNEKGVKIIPALIHIGIKTLYYKNK
ncbi:MAG: type III pantothenate kinase [bacterium]|nr:type III pantothenate kinase [bacterium]